MVSTGQARSRVEQVTARRPCHANPHKSLPPRAFPLFKPPLKSKTSSPIPHGPTAPNKSNRPAKAPNGEVGGVGGLGGGPLAASANKTPSCPLTKESVSQQPECNFKQGLKGKRSIHLKKGRDRAAA